jgi:hypothetical protein
MKANRQITPQSVLEFLWKKSDALIQNMDKMTEEQIENALHDASKKLRLRLVRLEYTQKIFPSQRKGDQPCITN